MGLYHFYHLQDEPSPGGQKGNRTQLVVKESPVDQIGRLWDALLRPALTKRTAFLFPYFA